MSHLAAGLSPAVVKECEQDESGRHNPVQDDIGEAHTGEVVAKAKQYEAHGDTGVPYPVPPGNASPCLELGNRRLRMYSSLSPSRPVPANPPYALGT